MYTIDKESIANVVYVLKELEPSVGDALLRLWDRYPNYQKRSSPNSGGMKTLLKQPQHGKQQSSPQQQQHKSSSGSPGGQGGKAMPKDSGGKKVGDMRKDSVDKVGPEGDATEGRGRESQSSPSSPGASSPCNVSSGSQESYNPDLDPSYPSPQPQPHPHPDTQGYPPRGFGFQSPASSAPLMGVFPPGLQVAPGFNQMYHMGHMGPAVLPSQSAMSPRPGISPVMILQRGAGGSPGQVHPHPGFMQQGFGGQAPGAYQGQGGQGQK